MGSISIGKDLKNKKMKRIISIMVFQIEKMIINGNEKYISDQTGDTLLDVLGKSYSEVS